MDIIAQTNSFVTTHILPFVKPKHKKLFSFGMQALSFTHYTSLGSNARQIIANAHTASSKMYRLMKNKVLVDNFHKLIVVSHLVTKQSLINVDFSTFCGFQSLVFALQTNIGRALPVWNDCLTYPIKEEGSQNIFVLEQVKKFGKTLGFFPRFVYDRGFWIPCLMQFLLRGKIPFYLRIKAGQHLEWVSQSHKGITLPCLNATKATDKRKKNKKKKGRRGKKRNKKATAESIGTITKDAQITLFGYPVRLIVSPPPPKQTNPKKHQNTQRWYIITNDQTSMRSEILRIYKTRFEIEETFKDMKHIQKMKILHINEKQTFTTLLWFATLTFWIAYWVEKETPRGITELKKKLSFFRSFWERFQRAIRQGGLNSAVGLLPAPA